jgi:phosphate transport system permease protein
MVEHSSIGSVLPPAGSPVAKRRRAWREFKDRVARYGVAMGGVSVIFAIVLIFFYLLYVVLPLFYGAEVHTKSEYQYSANSARYLALNEYNDVALSVDISGQVAFFAADTGKEILTPQLPLPESSSSSS